MSVIAFKKFEDKIQVAFDGRCIYDDEIGCENFIKAYRISDSLIIGATGLADTVEMFKNFVEVNIRVFEELESRINAIPLFIRFKKALTDQYGFVEDDIKNLGGFLIANKKYHAVYYYADNTYRPYPTREENDSFAFGSTGIYTSALIDAGLSIEDAIKMSAKKYNSINDNVTTLEIQR